MKTLHLLAITSVGLGLFATTAGAHDTWRDRESTEARHEWRNGVMTPPSGVPMQGQSFDSGSGNAMVQRDQFDVFADEGYHTSTVAGENMGMRRHARTHEMRHDWASDETSTRSAAPSERYYDRDYYGFASDIPALKNVDLDVALNRLHHINQKEIDFAKLAESHAKSPDVLNLAHRIRGDHEILDNKVKNVADRKSIKLEGFQLSTYEKALRDRLADLKGADFDQAFLRVNERGHMEAEHALRTARAEINDTDTRNLINEALPTMQAHMSVRPEPNRAKARTEDENLGK